MEFTLFNILDILGTIAFAISGALAAMDRRLDLFGIFIIGFVTAIGGGTLRDTLIGNTPVTWMENTIYVYLIGAVTILAIIFRNKINYLKKSLFLFDTIGLGIFTITGVEIGIRNDLDPIICVAIGAMTGTFGGVIRDILCNEIPVIFRKEIYATACIVGGLVFVIMHDLEVNRDIIYLTTSIIVIAIRLIVVKYHISLPYFYISSEKK
ncbi:MULTISPECIES: trimeric intracellular cation channel family protein [Salegentibacter]|uniref:Trimeric intracellular cation channel family protein n=1 Tax=Salegentibacter maritimus TaxID=2794347 RepID=A0ABS0TEI4_9FLAO|nr:MULTISPECIES: trimeric intracellular cation channel family protein [Salegentibacter]MBE7639054.1 trimeric intracellular cation channel family protein [Salegentibacter sp. BLCTC]MBI6115398.1 trimeric intracellular cation channel family protein [Salegentibacter maritimus]MBI6119082.1 trimeric intracellular cation channel family protein [Salegentibacter maritimus]